MKYRSIDRRRFGLVLGLGVIPWRLLWAEGAVKYVPIVGLDDWKVLAKEGHIFEHWTPEEDSQWKWYRLERYVDGTWKSVALSLPIHKETGEPYQPQEGYILPQEIPSYVLEGDLPSIPMEVKKQMAPSQFAASEAPLRLPDPEIRLRDGRPPIEWLRSLYAEELRSWLETVDAPESSVSGMTFWVHLVRDHGFDPRRIEGLTEHEYLLLHSAAHYGY